MSDHVLFENKYWYITLEGLLFIAASVVVLSVFLLMFVPGTTLECEEGEYIVIVDFVPTGDEWQLQPDGTYACCVEFNETMVEEK